MRNELSRSRTARLAAETALVRVVHHYGERPQFVLIGGLVPEYLCSGSDFRHAGTTDVDVQVDLEIARGTVNVRRLENALRNAEFEPDADSVWRWSAGGPEARVNVKFELLADDDHVRSGDTLVFDDCEALGAVNLHGTAFAARDFNLQEVSGKVGDLVRRVEINVTGLAGFLLAKTAAARNRRKPKDWYDIAFVLLHNDMGGPEEAARAVLDRFEEEIRGSTRTGLLELEANFSDARSQGARAYGDQMIIDHPQADRAVLAADSIVAVKAFCQIVLGG